MKLDQHLLEKLINISWFCKCGTPPPFEWAVCAASEKEALKAISEMCLLGDNLMALVFDRNPEATELLLNIILQRSDQPFDYGANGTYGYYLYRKSLSPEQKKHRYQKPDT